MPVRVDHCWITPTVCTSGDFDPLQRHSYSPRSDWWHRVYIEIWGSTIFHTCPAVSITSNDFTMFQIVLRNPSLKLEIHFAVIHSTINCIFNIDFLWSIFPVTIFYSLSLILFKEWGCLSSSFNVQCLFHPAFHLLASSPATSLEPLSFSLSSCCFSG